MAVNPNQNCKVANQLEENGIILDSKWAFNPVRTFAPQRKKLTSFMRDLDGTQYCNRFKHIKAPLYFPANRVEQMLYYRGALAFFKKGKEFFLLPFVPVGDLNAYGFMHKVQPIAFNGGEYKKSEAVKVGNEIEVNLFEDKDKNKCVILWDRQNGLTTSAGMEPKFILQNTIINEIVNRLSFLNINLVNSQGKNIILVKDPKQKGAVEKALSNVYASDKAYAVVKSMFEVQVINNEITYEEQSLWEDITSWNNLRLDGLGINNNGMFNKKERVLQVQTKTGQEETEVISDAFYEARKEFIKTIREVFKDDEDFKRDWAEYDIIDLRIDSVKNEESEENNEQGDDEDYDDNIML